MPAECGWLKVPSLELDAELAHYAFNATLADLITYYEAASQGPMFGHIREELMHVTTST
jgi:hypothetical protein